MVVKKKVRHYSILALVFLNRSEYPEDNVSEDLTELSNLDKLGLDNVMDEFFIETNSALQLLNLSKNQLQCID